MMKNEINNMKAPKLSVIMPVHNALPFLNESISSIINQTLADFEFVMLDDASTDGSAEVLREWEKRDSRIRVFQSDRKLGLSASSNLIVARANGQILARMDADDISHPERLIRQWKIMESRPEVAVVGTLCHGIDSAGRLTRPRDRWRLVRHSRYIPFPHGSVMFRREAFDRINGYDERLWVGEDQDFFYKMTGVGSVVTLPDDLYYFRYHLHNTTLTTDAQGVHAVTGGNHQNGNDLAALYLLGAMRLWAGQPPRVLPELIAKKALRWNLRSLIALGTATLGSVSPETLRFFLRSFIRGRDRIAGLMVTDGRACEVTNSPAFKLAACIDVDQNALDVISADLNVPREQCFTDLQTAIEKTGCQAVIVATPPDSHVEPVEAALSRGTAVMVEKPFTLSLREAVKLVDLADRKKVPLLVAQNYRYLRSFRAVRRVIAEGTLGHIGIVNCHYYRPSHDMAMSLARLPHSILWGMGVHHLDALRHALGKRVTNVAAESFTLPGGKLPTGASLQAMLSFEDETRASYTATYESSGHQFFEKGQEFYVRFVGSRATLHVFQRWLILCENQKLPRLVRRGRREVTEEQILLRQLERAMLHGEPAEASGRDNLETVAVLEACVRSASDRTWINPQILLNEPT
jgi:predicted dehydrogenase/glycosyltransferase involved in cell wall biosynthesis